jgi:glycosyltransferase involved in cell wall biosynthesis
MPRVDIIVLNDMHPDDFPGAASIAYSHAKYLSQQFSTAFWHTSLMQSKISHDGQLEVRAIHCNPFFDKFFRRHMVTRLMSEFLSPFVLLKLTTLLLRNRPRIVWLNQIGNRLPRSVSLVLLLLRIKIVQTFHDFSIISPRKLYPQNILEGGTISLSRRSEINALYAFRRLLLKTLVNRNFQNICISELQSEIYGDVGVRNIEIIPNGIESCQCQERLPDSAKKNEVLFAGRSTGKGYSRICQIIQNNPSWKLVAAGERDLEITGNEYLASQQFEYVGFLSPAKLFIYMHRVKFVSVLSDCFDVYPTVALEGIIHNSKILTTKTTGVAKLVVNHGGGFLLDSNSTIVNLDELYDSCSGQDKKALYPIFIENSAQAYASLFISASVPTRP